ncbi:hypothetical protein O9G_002599 [Rozella allomycis CSF55]|uniref:ubiquitinyl hydrolase 1 n=1 Tax=Rozella allomycis (strain CSF55) TaxID=988480 RepID=A0A075ATT4_ROZAC|nr:hypothetical protein O9G_002599 [Rozella allomycis CSF55]|eukprot:EPZ32105.1 hypothetical protein O9G_002599 [Rozella allomycis CSF55]
MKFQFGVVLGSSLVIVSLLLISSDTKFKRKKKKRLEKQLRLPGLLNLSNACFLNSILQSLSSCSNLISYLVYYNNKAKILGNECKLHFSLWTLLVNLNRNERRILDASLLIKDITGSFGQLEQQDAHEFLQLFLNLLLRYDFKASRMQKGMKLLNYSSFTHIDTTEEVFSLEKEDLQSYWYGSLPFVGSLCTRNDINLSLFSVTTITLPINSTSRTFCLEDLLSRHFNESEFINDFICPYCTIRNALDSLKRKISNTVDKMHQVTDKRSLWENKLTEYQTLAKSLGCCLSSRNNMKESFDSLNSGFSSVRRHAELRTELIKVS